MLIQVVYCDNSTDTLESFTLSSLIRAGKIKAFKRSSGWVHIGKDPIRKFDFAGQERMEAFANHENDLPQLQETYF
jgi:hypothetical protein